MAIEVYAIKFNDGLKFFNAYGAPLMEPVSSLEIDDVDYAITDEFLVGTLFSVSLSDGEHDGQIINACKGIVIESANKDDIKAVKGPNGLKFFYANGVQVSEAIKELIINNVHYAVKSEFLLGTKFDVVLNGETLHGTIVREVEDDNGGESGGETPLVTLNVTWDATQEKYVATSDTTAEQIDALIADNKIPTLIVKNENDDNFLELEVGGEQVLSIHNSVGQFAGSHAEPDSETGDVLLVGYDFNIIYSTITGDGFHKFLLVVGLRYNQDNAVLALYPLEFENLDNEGF